MMVTIKCTRKSLNGLLCLGTEANATTTAFECSAGERKSTALVCTTIGEDLPAVPTADPSRSALGTQENVMASILVWVCL